ncbi:MAG: hypothetical protein HXY42_06220 [Chloroflexi bacterium]|nr:hypothetical protein [Chloroflexota bacterium]
MLDAVQIPILLKAIDFVFDEGRRILEERRERRKAEASAPQTQTAPPEEAEALPLPPEQAEAVKKYLTAAKIDELLWKNHEAEIKHLVALLETYSRNYHLSKEQYAKWGSALVPPIIIHNLTEAEHAMLNTLKQLETVLSKVYKKDIQSVS